jgi:phage gp29-like protein
MAKSLILGPNGQPLERDLLTREIAEAQLTGTRSVWSHNSIANHLTPHRLSSVLERAAQGDIVDFLTLAEEMEEREPHYSSVLGTRKRAVSGVSHEIVAGSDSARDEEIAQSVRGIFSGEELPDLAEDVLDALGKGFSATEIKWETSAKQWKPSKMVWRDPRFFRFDQRSGDELLLIDEEYPLGRPLPPFKFITHSPRIKCGLKIRGGLARMAAVTYLCKSVALGDWMVFAELFGMPIRVGKYGPNATDAEKATLRNAVANIGSDAAAIIPQSMVIELLERVGSGNGEVAYEVLCNWLDRQTSKGVLGQTMTTDDGSSQAQANVHNDVREDICRADLRQLAKTLNRDLIRPYVDLNYGPQENYPFLRFPIADALDIAAMTNALKELVPFGLKVGQDGVRKKLALPEPQEGEELLRPNAWATPAEPTEPTDTKKTGLNREEPILVDQGDDLVDSELEDWERYMNPVIDPLRSLADRAQSADDFIAGLPALLDDMDDTELVRRLATSFYKARALGDARD